MFYGINLVVKTDVSWERDDSDDMEIVNEMKFTHICHVLWTAVYSVAPGV